MVTDMGVFEKIGDDDEFTLTGYFANPQLSTVYGYNPPQGNKTASN